MWWTWRNSINSEMDILEKTAQKLIDVLKSGRVPHTMLIAGLTGCGAEEIALSAASFLCGETENNPNFFSINNSEKIADLRIFIHEEMTKRPFRDGYRVVYIPDAHLLDETKQNTLLKSLEEPSPRTVFILTGPENLLLPTVRSRCTVIRVPLMTPEDVLAYLERKQTFSPDMKLYASCAMGIPELALRLCWDEDFRLLREATLEFISAIFSGKMPFTKIEELTRHKEDVIYTADFMLSFLRDLIARKENIAVYNTDRSEILGAFAPRFTSGQINCIIDAVAELRRRLSTNAKAGLAFDRFIIDAANTIA